MVITHIQCWVPSSGTDQLYLGTLTEAANERDVAIRVLSDLPAEPGPASRQPSLCDIQQLVARLARLNGADRGAIVAVHHALSIDGVVALVEARFEGPSLRDLLMRGTTAQALGAMPPRAAYELVAQVAAGLEAAWSTPVAGKSLAIPHRDVRPEHIHVDAFGSACLVRFGIPSATPEATYPLPGDAARMASSWRDATPEADVYALGCTLFEALTGERLLSGPPAARRRDYERILADRCTAHREGLGSDRAVALLRAMAAFRKGDRPRAGDVAARCDLISDGIPGPTLAQWCRDQDFERDLATDLADDPRGLVGRRIEFVPPDLEIRRAPVSLLSIPIPALRDLANPDRAPVLGEIGSEAPSTDEISEATSGGGRGAMPWSDAEMLALFSDKRTPSLAPARRPLPPRPEPRPDRVPQLERQQVDHIPALSAPLDPLEAIDPVDQEVTEQLEPAIVARLKSAASATPDPVPERPSTLDAAPRPVPWVRLDTLSDHGPAPEAVETEEGPHPRSPPPTPVAAAAVPLPPAPDTTPAGVAPSATGPSQTGISPLSDAAPLGASAPAPIPEADRPTETGDTPTAAIMRSELPPRPEPSPSSGWVTASADANAASPLAPEPRPIGAPAVLRAADATPDPHDIDDGPVWPVPWRDAPDPEPMDAASEAGPWQGESPAGEPVPSGATTALPNLPSASIWDTVRPPLPVGGIPEAGEPESIGSSPSSMEPADPLPFHAMPSWPRPTSRRRMATPVVWMLSSAAALAVGVPVLLLLVVVTYFIMN